MRQFHRLVQLSLSLHTTAICCAGGMKRIQHRPLLTWTSSPWCVVTMRSALIRASYETSTSSSPQSPAAEERSLQLLWMVFWQHAVFLEQGIARSMIDYKSGFIWTHDKDSISNWLNIRPIPQFAHIPLQFPLLKRHVVPECISIQPRHDKQETHIPLTTDRRTLLEALLIRGNDVQHTLRFMIQFLVMAFRSHGKERSFQNAWKGLRETRYSRQKKRHFEFPSFGVFLSILFMQFSSLKDESETNETKEPRPPSEFFEARSER